MTREGALALLLAAMFLWAGAALGEERLRLERGAGGGPVELQAETLTASENGERLQAEGGVLLVWQGYRLQADRLSYDREKGSAEADGSVLLEDPNGNLLRARHLTISTETQEGTVTDGTLTLVREGYRIWGTRFVKTGPTTYMVEDGGFTTCEGTWPSWRVQASRVRIQQGAYLVSRNATFWVESVPTAFTPYLVFPVKTERQSGFLIPKVGYSDRSGALLVVPYYWAFSDSADVVFRVEYRSRRGVTEGAEYRYALAEGHEGSGELTHAYDRLDQSNRYRIKADHKDLFTPATQARVHVDYLGDTHYLSDYGDTLLDRGVERLESYLVTTHAVEYGSLFGLLDYFEPLHQPRAEALQTLPSVGLLGREAPLVAGVNLDPTVRFTRYQRGEGLRGERLEVHPVLSRGWNLGGVGIAARAGYRGHLYDVEGDEIFRGASEGSLTASALLARTYGRYLHTFEPKVVFYWEDGRQEGDVPVFDAEDAFGRRSEVGLLMENRLLRASDLSAVAGLDLERTLGLAAGEPQLLKFKASFTPTEKVSFRTAGEYDPSEGEPWRAWSAAGEYTDERGDKLQGGYHYVNGRVSYADVQGSFAATRELALIYRHNYSFSDGRTLEEAYAVHLTHPCWELVVSYSRNFRDDDRYEHRYYAVLQLKGLGKIGTLRGILP